MSRDDYGSFITRTTCEKRHHRRNDPFQTIDRDGVGGLMQIGVEKGRKTRGRTSRSASAASTAATRPA